MEIKQDDYHILFVETEATLYCKGLLMLNGSKAYADILFLFQQACDEVIETGLTNNLTALEFLNSSGINTFTKFIIYGRNKNLSLQVIGLENTPWQVRLIKNLQRLMPTLTMILV